MKKCMYLSVLYAAALLVACGSDPKDDPTPTPPEPPVPEYETEMAVGTIPDSVKVESSAEVKFTISQKDHPEDFSVKVDTVIPSYYQYLSLCTGSIEGIPGGGYFWEGEDIRYGKADITINGKNLADLKSLANGKENAISFSNPTAVGEYMIVLEITDKYKRTAKKEIKLKVWSPEIVVKFYFVDPWIELGYDEDEFYECLNRDYSYDPLSDIFKGKRIDTLYTMEAPTNYPTPGSWTVPGYSVVCHIGQEGNDEIQSIQASSSFLIEKGKILSSTTWASQFDGKEGKLEARKGFHGIRFETSTLTDVGTQYYTIRVVDKWGKEKMETIVYKAFDRNYQKPEGVTKDSWAHYIAD